MLHSWTLGGLTRVYQSLCAVHCTQELEEREELKRQQEEFRLEQEEIERHRLEKEKIEQEELEMKQVCTAVDVWAIVVLLAYYTM